jgi:Gram-negative bacterial TonB protein C-terminal
MKKIKTLVLILACSVTAFAQVRPQVIRISSGVLHGLVQHAEVPKYPEEALQSRTQGDVILKVVLDNSGKVILSAPVEGDLLLVAVSIDALRDFQFQPYLLNGEPMLRVESQIGFRFSINGDGEKASGTSNTCPPFRFGRNFARGL